MLLNLFERSSFRGDLKLVTTDLALVIVCRRKPFFKAGPKFEPKVDTVNYINSQVSVVKYQSMKL